MEESLLVTLAALGVRRVSLVQARCAQCEHVSGFEMARVVCDTASALLATWNNDMRIDLAEKLPSSVRRAGDEGYDASRRSFFSSMKDEAKNVAAVTADYAVKDALGVEERREPRFVKVGKDGTLPHFIPDRRERLLAALDSLGQPQDVLMDTRLWGHVIIDPEKCTSCQMCATFCPTEAIHKFGDAATAAETSKRFGIDHYTGRCVQCRCCEDICPTGALTLSTDVFAADVTKRGRSERIPMKPRARKVNDPKSIVNAMSALLNVPNVYER